MPSMVRQPAASEGLAAVPHAAEPTLLRGIKVWHMARGVRIELPLQKAEMIYGLGLQCKHLEQNGWRRTLSAGAGDNGKGACHAPVPFYASTAGYGVLVDSARYMMFSVGEKQRLESLSTLEHAGGEKKPITDLAQLYGAEKRDATSVYVDVPVARGVDLYVFAGPDLGRAVARYNLFSGGGCLPPLAALGPGYICGTMLDAKAICAMGEQLKRDRIPVTSLGLEPGWQTHAYSSSYRWNAEKFPADFPATIRRQGYDLNLWCQAYIDPESPLLPLLGNRFGDFEVWRGVVPDLADAQVRQTYADFLRENFIRKGISGFKLDEVDGSGNSGGCNEEWQFPEFTAFPSGADGDQMHNLLGRFGAQAIVDAFRHENQRTLGLVRASHAWAAPVPMAIYSDEYDFPDYIRYNLSAGVQGLLWAPEIRDSANERDWALRVAASAFSARMLYNGWQFPHFPWQQPDLTANEHNQLLPDDNPYLKITRHFNNLRMMLLPYLYQAYSEYHRKGVSPVRPLVADWPEDSNTWHIDDQWMFGADLLIAPLTDANSFSSYRRQVVNDAERFRSLNGPCRITAASDAIELATDFDGLGIKGARTRLELQAGPCTVRFACRADAGSAGIRLWTPDGKEIPEFHIDDLPVGPGWQVGVARATLPTTGTYSLYIGKAHASTGARRIAFRNLTIVQRPRHEDAKTAWSREVYLPEGEWRDFWTGKVLKGGQHHVAAATPELPPVFVRAGTLLPLAEPLLTIDGKTVFTVHLAAYGDNPRPCGLLEDDGLTFDFEKGNCATLAVGPDGTVQRPDHGQPPRYRIVGKAESPKSLLQKLLGDAE